MKLLWFHRFIAYFGRFFCDLVSRLKKSCFLAKNRHMHGFKNALIINEILGNVSATSYFPL